MTQVRGAPYHPQTQGKIESWRQTLKNRILLKHYFLPRELKQQFEDFVDNYNHERYHESLNNVTPPMSTSAGHNQSSTKEKGSNKSQSNIDACNTVRLSLNINLRGE